jgi:hypothetical protein
MRWAIEGETRQVGGEEEDSSGGGIFGIEEDGSRMGDEGKRTFSVSSQLVHLIYLIVA